MKGFYYGLTEQYLVHNNKVLINDVDSFQTTNGTSAVCDYICPPGRKIGRYMKDKVDRNEIDMNNFIPPEWQQICRHEKPITNKADIWRTGRILQNSFITKHKSSQPVLDKAKSKLNDLIKKMRSLEAEKRPDIEFVILEVEKVFDDLLNP